MTSRALVGVILVGLVLSAVAAPAPEFPVCAVDGFQLSLQAYTFRGQSLLETIDTAKELKIEFIEAYPGQAVGGGLPGNFGVDSPPEVLQAVRDKLAANGVKLRLFGVTGFPGDEAGSRRVFEWAKSLGIEVLTAEPPQDQLPMLDTLCNEYGIRIAIHNHPQPSRYWDPAVLAEAVKDCSPMIGACVDSGHWARSGLDTVASLKLLEGRVISFHLKDINAKERGAHDVVWGNGVVDMAALLAEAKRQGFAGWMSIEYEVNDEHLKDNVAACVAWFYETTAALAEG